MEELNYFLVDTFVAAGCKGNTTPVCFLSEEISSRRMQELATGFGAAVSVFVNHDSENDLERIRYFTVTEEIPACGHGTIGAAFAMAIRKPITDSLVFETNVGVKLMSSRVGELFYIDYPIYQLEKTETSREILEALQVSEVSGQFYSPDLETLFLEVPTAEKVIGLSPDFLRLKESSNDLKEVVVMSATGEGDYDLVLRAFCPWVGIDEDPVTGSVHSVLAPYWIDRLNKEKGEVLQIYQASERGGKLSVLVEGDRVRIGGRCHHIASGNLKF